MEVLVLKRISIILIITLIASVLPVVSFANDGLVVWENATITAKLEFDDVVISGDDTTVRFYYNNTLAEQSTPYVVYTLYDKYDNVCDYIVKEYNFPGNTAGYYEETISFDIDNYDGYTIEATAYSGVGSNSPVCQPKKIMGIAQGPVTVTNIRVKTGNDGSYTDDYYSALDNLQVGDLVYSDRNNHYYGAMSENLIGNTYLLTRNDDKGSSYALTEDTDFLMFDIDKSSTVYLLWHGGTVPNWILNEGFVLDAQTTCTRNEIVDKPVTVYKKDYFKEMYEETKTISLGGLGEGTVNAGYSFVIAPLYDYTDGYEEQTVVEEDYSGPAIVSNILVKNASGVFEPNASYQASRMEEGASLYTDRTFVYADVPEKFIGASYIRTKNSDRDSSHAKQGSDEFLKFKVDRSVEVYVLCPASACVGAWMTTNGFSRDTTEELVAIRRNENGTVKAFHSIYKKEYRFVEGQQEQEIVLGDLNVSNTSGNYGVILVTIDDGISHGNANNNATVTVENVNLQISPEYTLYVDAQISRSENTPVACMVVETEALNNYSGNGTDVYAILQYLSDTNGVRYFKGTMAKNGKISISTPYNEKFKIMGAYNIYLMPLNGRIHNTSFEMKEYNEILSDRFYNAVLNAQNDEAAVQAMLNVENREYFELAGIDVDYFSGVEITALEQLAQKMKNNAPSGVDNRLNYFKTEASLTLVNSVGTADELIEAIGASSIFNGLTDEGSLYEYVTSDVKTQMREAIFNNIRNNAYQSIDRFKEDFVSSGIVLALNSSRYEKVDGILKAANDVLKLDLEQSKYINNKLEFAKAFSAITFTNVNDVKTLFTPTLDEIAKKSNAKPSPIGGGGGGGSSGGIKPVVGNGMVAVGNQVPTTEPSVSGTKAVFTDMEGYNWAKDAVEMLYKHNIISGKSENLFCPGDSIKREEFIKILILSLFEIDTSAVAPFTDVNKFDWSYPYIATAHNIGLAKGEGNVFGLGKEITREDMAVLIARATKIKNVELSLKQSVSFDDEFEISDYAKESVRLLSANGIINGTGNNKVEPKGTATRAQAAVMLYNLFNKTGLEWN